jgi:ribosomal protein L40E
MQQGPIETIPGDLRCRSCGAANPVGSTTCGSCGGTKLKTVGRRRLRGRRPKPTAPVDPFPDAPATAFTEPFGTGSSAAGTATLTRGTAGAQDRRGRRIWLWVLAPLVWFFTLGLDLALLTSWGRDSEADASDTVWPLVVTASLPLMMVVFAWAGRRRAQERPWMLLLLGGVLAVNLLLLAVGYLTLPTVV